MSAAKKPPPRKARGPKLEEDKRALVQWWAELARRAKRATRTGT